MKKATILVLSFVLVFLVSIGIVSAQVSPQAAGQALCKPVEFGILGSGVACSISNACGFNKCEGIYTPCESAASAKCITCMNGCSAPGSPPGCVAGCVADFQGMHEACMGSAIAAQNTLLSSGSFLANIVPCNEMNSCIKDPKRGLLTSETMESGMLKCPELDMDARKKVVEELKKRNSEFRRIFENSIQLDDPEWQKVLLEEMTKGYDFVDTNRLAQFIQSCKSGECGVNSKALSKALTAQDSKILAAKEVRDAMAFAEVKLPWWKQALVTGNVLNQNLVFRWGTRIAGVASTGYGIYNKLFAGEEEDEEEAPFNRNTQQLAQNDWNSAQSAAQNPQVAGDSVWTSCPGHRDGRCAGQAFCVTDEMGASQCISALPGGGDVTVAFSSIYIIDNIQKNLFTLKGPQNDGVVYHDDGFVNIDKGGTTKISVAGIGALITDFIMNRLFLGRGTTTYLGNGNADAGTYLTNTFILDYSSSVGVDAVNPTEQNRFKESTQIANFKQDNELAFTVNQLSLKPYKNAVDIGNLQGQYQILTRGFSNIVLAEKDKIFPLMTRNFAKGDALIVKNKGVKIPNTYLVNDGNYQYTIKTIGDSTKVLAKNGKVIQDSGPLGSQLSRRQAILVYNV